MSFPRMGLTLDVQVTDTPDAIRIDISGEGGEVLLKRKGEILDALQQIVNTGFRRELDDDRSFVVDCLGYRKGKDEELKQMTRFTMEKATRLGAAGDGPAEPVLSPSRPPHGRRGSDDVVREHRRCVSEDGHHFEEMKCPAWRPDFGSSGSSRLQPGDPERRSQHVLDRRHDRRDRDAARPRRDRRRAAERACRRDDRRRADRPLLIRAASRDTRGRPTRTGHAIDQAVVTHFPAPHSYTGDDVVEISAHGSPVVLEAIVGAAVAAGARIANPGEFTFRAYPQRSASISCKRKRWAI